MFGCGGGGTIFLCSMGGPVIPGQMPDGIRLDGMNRVAGVCVEPDMVKRTIRGPCVRSELSPPLTDVTNFLDRAGRRGR